MKIRLSDHFTVKRLLRFTLPSIVMMIFTSIYGVVDGIFVSNFVGKTPFAAVNFIYLAVFFGYSQGMAPVVSYHFGAENTGELKSLLKKSLVLIAIASVSMFLLAEALGPALSSVFVGYDLELFRLTKRAFAIYSISFLFSGLAIFGSGFFTALNDGVTSAIVSFLRTLVFQIGAVLLLPLIFGLDGIWLSIVAAELIAAVIVSIFLIVKRKKFRY